MIKNKKGFTLVELLAVIVILAIILVIAVPQIIKTIDSAREGAFSSSAKLIATTAEKEYLARKTIGDTSFEGLDTIPCTDVVKENTNDYQSCDISFDENGKATVTLIGKGKFAGKYICNGTRNSATVMDVDCPDGIVRSEEELKSEMLVIDEITLAANIVLTETLVIPSSMTLTLNLEEYSISGNWNKSEGAVIKNEGDLTIENGTISSTGDNGGAAITNSGTMYVKNVDINGAPQSGSGGPAYAINNAGNITLDDSTIISVHGAFSSYGAEAIATINNSAIEISGMTGSTIFAVYTYNDGKVIINDSTVINNAIDQHATGSSAINGYVTVNSGFIKGRLESFYGVPTLKGGTYTENPSRFVAEGYKVTTNEDGMYVIEKDESSQ